MRVLVCGIVEADFARTTNAVGVSSFIDIVKVVATCDELLDAIANESVDVCLCGSGWVRDISHVNKYLTSRGLKVPKWVIVTRHLTGSLCLEAVFQGVDDLIDAREGIDGFVQRLLLVGNGFSAQDGAYPVPPRWDVSLPFMRQAIQDDTDAAIMRSLLHGKSNSDIAADVHLSCQTVNNRISQMIHRTRTSNRTQLALLFAESPHTSLSFRSHSPELH